MQLLHTLDFTSHPAATGPNCSGLIEAYLLILHLYIPSVLQAHSLTNADFGMQCRTQQLSILTLLTHKYQSASNMTPSGCGISQVSTPVNSSERISSSWAGKYLSFPDRATFSRGHARLIQLMKMLQVLYLFLLQLLGSSWVTGTRRFGDPGQGTHLMGGHLLKIATVGLLIIRDRVLQG